MKLLYFSYLLLNRHYDKGHQKDFKYADNFDIRSEK